MGTNLKPYQPITIQLTVYFELHLEDVYRIVELEKPKGVVVQYGGQTPLKLSQYRSVPILGTTPDAIDRAEDRERFAELVTKLFEAARQCDCSYRR